MQSDWEVWLDTNISPAIAKWMADYTGLTVKSAYILSLNQLSDLEVYSKAKASGRIIIISKDSDFPELISRLGSPPKLIFLKIGNCSNRSLWNFLTQHIQDAISILANSDIDIVELD
jgi:predicted nuclease of predicted toxin-antitoxin system